MVVGGVIRTGRASSVSRSSGESLDGRRRVHRLYCIVALGLLWVGLLVARLYDLQITNTDRWHQRGAKQHSTEITIASERGPILDRNGKLLAVSVPAGSVFVRPGQIKDLGATAKILGKALGLSPELVKAKLSKSEPFVWLKRQIPRLEAQRVDALKIPGVGYVLESRRYYPFNDSASSLIGKVGVDGDGLTGLERAYNRSLEGNHVVAKVGRDALGKVIQTSLTQSDSFDLPNGLPLQLTIDSDLQLIMDEELQLGRSNAKSKAAMAVMIDAETGEIFGMSQAPEINLNNPTGQFAKGLKNLSVETVFEPGSILKPIVAAAALDAGVIKPFEQVNCENGRFQYSTHLIKDVHPSGVIPFHDVVVRSSNIGMTKVGLRLGSQRLYGALKAFGYGESSGLKLPGETGGILRNVKNWAKIDTATHSFGQGVAVTPLQMVRAVAAIANGGKLPGLKLLNDQAKYSQERIISDRTAALVRDMMYGVVEDEHGTGHMAALSGVRIGGKTGTAQKAISDGRGYQSGAYMASFVGFVDGRPVGIDKTLVLMVVIDEPNAKSIYGGTLAAPVFKRIIQRSLQFLATKTDQGRARPAEGGPEVIEPKMLAPQGNLLQVSMVNTVHGG